MHQKRTWGHAYDEYHRYSNDIICGESRICSCRRGDQSGWMLPGMIFTTSRVEADAAARIIELNRRRVYGV